MVAQGESGSRLAEKRGGRTMPTAEERREHISLVRSWCSHCVRGKGTQVPQRRQQETPTRPGFHMDSTSREDEHVAEKMAVLVIKERSSKM